MKYVSDPLVLVVGVCLGFVAAIVAVMLVLYQEHKNEQEKFELYFAKADEPNEKYELLSLIQEYGGRIVNIKGSLIEYSCTPVIAANIVYRWLNLDSLRAVM